MTEPRVAKLFWLTEPQPGQFIVNFQIGEKLTRIQISREHLANATVEGATMIRKAFLGEPR